MEFNYWGFLIEGLIKVLGTDFCILHYDLDMGVKGYDCKHTIILQGGISPTQADSLKSTLQLEDEVITITTQGDNAWCITILV